MCPQFPELSFDSGTEVACLPPGISKGGLLFIIILIPSRLDINHKQARTGDSGPNQKEFKGWSLRSGRELLGEQFCRHSGIVYTNTVVHHLIEIESK